MRQVRVLVVEDEEAKRNDICAEISSFFNSEVAIDECETFGCATQKIFQQEYDLVIIDLLLPRRKDESPVDVSDEMIEHLEASELNRLATTVAISQYDDLVAKRQENFAKAGIFLIGYPAGDSWRSCLRVCMQRVAIRTTYDFVVVCALELEREAFEGVNCPDFSIGEYQTVQGLDLREISIGNRRGVCVLQPRMGLVDASIVATRALDAFNPQLICMSGICGGFPGEVPLGALLVSDPTWEHQAGKWTGDQFEIRGFQEPLDNNEVRTPLSQLIERDPRLQNLASKSHQVAVPHEEAAIRPTVSGSAVIASEKYADQIKDQHGKVSGIDMEVYGVYRAAKLHGHPVRYFAAKTVVDHANEAKASDLQQAGAILSARFVVEAIKQLLPDAPVSSTAQPTTGDAAGPL